MIGKSTSASVHEIGEGSVYEEGPGQAVDDLRELDGIKQRTDGLVAQVSEWMRGEEDDGSQVDGGSRSGSSGIEVPETTAVAYAVSGLAEFAKRVQRLSRQQLARKMRKGRGVYAAQKRGGPVGLKQYSLVGTRTVLDLEKADGIYDELNAEKRVVCQVAARTAIGKTTKWPAMIATRCKRRVLLVEPNVSLAKSAADVQRPKVSIRIPWERSRVSVLTTMTYADFVCQFRGQNGVEMLRCFDVVILDEADRKDCDTVAAKSLFATFAEDTSLIVCSATFEGDDLQALGKTVDVKTTARTLRSLADSGVLVSGPCGKDRTLVIATDDREAQYVGSKIAAAGCDVMVLDSANRPEEQIRVDKFLVADVAVTNRFLVVTPEYGYGSNFFVGNLVTSGEKRVNRMSKDGRTFESVVVKVSDAELKQQIGRANRGVTASATALVCADEGEKDRAVETMEKTERLRYYVTMVASHVTPTQQLFDEFKSFLPFGLTQKVAADILATNVPVEIAVRFFAEDGRLPYKYLEAIGVYSEPDHDFLVSEHNEPYGKDKWVEEEMTSYYDNKEDGMPRLSVPCHADGDMKVIVHSVCAAALGLLDMEDWRPTYEDSDTSDTEVIPEGKTVDRYMPRLVTNSAPIRTRRVDYTPYAYGVPQELQYAPRSRIAVAPGFIAQEFARALAVIDTNTSQTDFAVSCEIQEFVETGSERVGIVHKSDESTPVEVSSPGGSVVMAFKKTVWLQMVTGEALIPKDAQSFFHAMKHNVEGFAQSDAFSGWSEVWFSVLRTVAQPENMELIKTNNYVVRVMSLIMAMVSRYVTAVGVVSRTSVLKSKLLQTMLTTRLSYDDVYRRQASRGRVEIAQSAAFMKRLFAIRDELVTTLEGMEEGGIFAPTVVSKLQELLPIMKRTGKRLYDKPTSSRRYLTSGR